MIRITTDLIDKVVEQARTSPRLRMNYNFHPELTDPVQRLLNALEPWTYIRPHKHTTKEESFVLLRGTILAVVFNDNGTNQRIRVYPSRPAAGEGDGTFHVFNILGHTEHSILRRDA